MTWYPKFKPNDLIYWANPDPFKDGATGRVIQMVDKKSVILLNRHTGRKKTVPVKQCRRLSTDRTDELEMIAAFVGIPVYFDGIHCLHVGDNPGLPNDDWPFTPSEWQRWDGLMNVIKFIKVNHNHRIQIDPTNLKATYNRVLRYIRKKNKKD